MDMLGQHEQDVLRLTISLSNIITRILTGLTGLSPVRIKKFSVFCGLNKDSLGNETKKIFF